MPSFDRGFKSWAERCATGLRQELNLEPYQPLNPRDLARYLGVRLLTPRDIPGLPSDCIKQLLQTDPEGWSAVTLSNGDQHIVIYNPSHSRGRQAGDIMHELAHLVAGHEPSKVIVSTDGALVMRTYDQKQEDEADWLSGCLLLPREALLYVKRIGLNEREIRQQYCVTSARLRYRIGMTGVDRQLRFRQRYLPSHIPIKARRTSPPPTIP